MNLGDIIQELQTLRQVLPGDAPVGAWLLSPAAGLPELAVLEVCGVTGGVHRGSGRLGVTLQLRLLASEVAARGSAVSADDVPVDNAPVLASGGPGVGTPLPLEPWLPPVVETAVGWCEGQSGAAATLPGGAGSALRGSLPCGWLPDGQAETPAGEAPAGKREPVGKAAAPCAEVAGSAAALGVRPMASGVAGLAGGAVALGAKVVPAGEWTPRATGAGARAAVVAVSGLPSMPGGEWW